MGICMTMGAICPMSCAICFEPLAITQYEALYLPLYSYPLVTIAGSHQSSTGKAIPDLSLNASRSPAVQSVTSIFPGSWANTSPSIFSPAISTANCGVTPHA